MKYSAYSCLAHGRVDQSLLFSLCSSSSSSESLHGLTGDTQTKRTSIRTIDHLSRHWHSSDGSSHRCPTDLWSARFLQASELYDYLWSSLLILVLLLTDRSIALSSLNRSLPRVSAVVVARSICRRTIVRRAETTLAGKALSSLNIIRKMNVTIFECSFSNPNWIFSIWPTTVIECKWKQIDCRPLLTMSIPITNLDLQRIEQTAMSVNHRVSPDVCHRRDGTRGRKWNMDWSAWARVRHLFRFSVLGPLEDEMHVL